MTFSTTSQSLRPRVFVSSVIEGFQKYRKAARQAIENVGGEPILVNEDFPARGQSSLNACLDAVDSCDVYIAIIGERGGWKTPSGKLVVEEEYHRAKARKLPVLAFLQKVKRDAEAQRLAEDMSDYVDGLFRATFQSSTELGSEIERALKPLMQISQKPHMEKDKLLDALKDPYKMHDKTSLRFVVVPERSEEVIDPVRLSSSEFAHRVLEIGHAKDIQLLSYRQSKEERIEGESLVIDQSDSHGRGEAVRRCD